MKNVLGTRTCVFSQHDNEINHAVLAPTNFVLLLPDTIFLVGMEESRYCYQCITLYQDHHQFQRFLELLVRWLVNQDEGHLTIRMNIAYCTFIEVVADVGTGSIIW